MSISPLDFILLQLGTPGYYLAFLGFLICCLQLPIVFTEYAFKYYIVEPPHRCKVTLATIGQMSYLWKDLNLHKNEWYPLVKVAERPPQYYFGSNIDQLLMLNTNKSSQMFDQCNIYIDPVHHWKGVQPCPNGWEYWSPRQQQNLITEFNLVCENKFLLTILTNLICISAFFGAILFGIAADKFGRCRILNSTIYLFVASALSVYFVADFLQFSIFYNLQIFFVNGLQVSAYVLLLEIFPTPYQLRANFFWFTFRSLVSILISILVAAINDWRYMQLSIAVPSFAFITYLFVIPSSPLWQTVVQRNQRAAVKTLIHFSKFSGKSISPNQLNLHIQNLYTSTINFVTQIYEPISESSNSISRSQIKLADQLPSLYRPSPILRWYLLTNFYLFYLLTIVNSELFDQHTLILNQNQYVDSIYNTLIDLAFIILSYHFAIWLGSRVMQSLLFIINGLLIIVSLVLKEYLKYKSNVEINSFDFRLLLVPPILIVIARSIGRLILIFVTFHAVKSIPTNIRTIGLGCCIFWIQLAKISVPHLIVLSNYFPYNSLHCMFGALTIFSGVISLMFPRLELKPLPNTLIDLEESRKNNCNNSNCNSSLSTSTSKRYPSYRDLKINRKNRSTSAHDIYHITPNGDIIPTNSTIRSIKIKNDRNGNNGQEILILTTDPQTSLSSNSAKLVETEKTSISSSGGGNVNDQSFESTSNSFIQAQIIPNHHHIQRQSKSSYIPYNEFDPIGFNSSQTDNRLDFVDVIEQSLNTNIHRSNNNGSNRDLIESSSIHV